MQISDLIAQLAAIQAQHGDIGVETFSSEGDDWGPPNIQPLSVAYKSFDEIYDYDSEYLIGVAEINHNMYLVLQCP